MKKSQLYSLLGFLVGWGAPLGALSLRYFTAANFSAPYEFLEREWASNVFFYWYMLIGTCLAFYVFGFILGRQMDRAAEKMGI